MPLTPRKLNLVASKTSPPALYPRVLWIAYTYPPLLHHLCLYLAMTRGTRSHEELPEANYGANDFTLFVKMVKMSYSCR